MDKCEHCVHYNDETTYPDTGFCELNDVFVKSHESCEDYEEE